MAEQREFVCAREGESLVLRCSGDWSLRDGLPGHDEIRTEFARSRPQRFVLATARLGSWDSSLVAFFAGAASLADGEGIAVDASGLPAGLHKLLELARAVPEKKDARLR